MREQIEILKKSLERRARRVLQDEEQYSGETVTPKWLVLKRQSVAQEAEALQMIEDTFRQTIERQRALMEQIDIKAQELFRTRMTLKQYELLLNDQAKDLMAQIDDNAELIIAANNERFKREGK